MPTSGTTAWPLNFAALAESAARELGAIGMGDSLEASEQEEMQTRFNLMMESWSIKANLYREELAQITIPPATGAVTLPEDVRDIASLRYIASATNKRQLVQWNRSQWLSLPNRSQAGAPTVFYYSQKPGDEGDQLYVWPVPALSTDYELDYSRGAYIVTAPDETLDFPREWYEAAMFGLASRCAGIFGSTRVDPAAVQRVDARATALLEAMLDADRPDSYQFEWDSPVEAGG